MRALQDISISLSLYNRGVFRKYYKQNQHFLKMNFLFVQFFFIIFDFTFAAKTSMPCSKDVCRACSFIKSRNHYCLQLQEAKCCDAWMNRTHNSLVPSTSDKLVEKVIPEIFREKEASTFSANIILIICLCLIFFVVFIIQLERIIKKTVTKERKKKPDIIEKQFSADWTEFLL